MFVLVVAPLAGALIEIDGKEEMQKAMESLPSRERGLKFTDNGRLQGIFMSLPSRERGLKSKVKFSEPAGE